MLKGDVKGARAGGERSLFEMVMATHAGPAERWERPQELLRELARVRREDYRAGRLQIERCRTGRE